MKRTIILILCAGMFFVSECMAAVPTSERDALIALYNSTDGDNWFYNTNWLVGDPCENAWFGVTCDAAYTTIIELFLGYNDLSGTIPSELADLSNLYYLDMESNYLNGSIPSELADLLKLDFLNLSSNYLNGSIPSELANLSSLSHLYLAYNELSGSIPTELGNLLNLQELILSYNQLSGNIPAELGSLPVLERLILDNNNLSGSIPSELGNLSKLEYLELSDNALSGSIPSEIGSLSNLRRLDLGYNDLTGSIPDQIGDLLILCFLYLDNNQLTSSIPSQFGNFLVLRHLYLNNNQLTGSIPHQLGDVSSLRWLNLSNNELSGSIPSELGNLSELSRLQLQFNELDGTIPDFICDLSDMEILQLGNNHLEGEIPSGIGSLVNLWTLSLNNNELSGSIPSELGNLTGLVYLYLQSNELSGSIPSELGNLPELIALGLKSNYFSGNIPIEIVNTNLWGDYSDLRWNALYTENDTLRIYLNNAQDGGDWESTQTIAPTGITAHSPSVSSITLDWTPIVYTADKGGYEVYYSDIPGGPYSYFGITADKLASTMTVTGLMPSTCYYFIIRTVTYPHLNNVNTVTSEASIEVSECTIAGSLGPPPVGDGHTAEGLPLLLNKSGDYIIFDYDEITCYGDEAVLLYGDIGSYGMYTGSADCNLEVAEIVDTSSLENVWFNVLWTSDGGSTAGHPGYESAAVMRAIDPTGFCAITGENVSDGVCD
ncbi:hypothetical protein JXQ70_05970 [bacterium]|nr:hypothetical protein [bacterium]